MAVLLIPVKFSTWCRIQQQQEVLAWLLEPLSQQWMQLEWQNNYLSEPLGLVRLCSDTSFMWSLFHTVTFFERALKRSGIRKANLNLQSSSAENSAVMHPMASHLSWMLPPLLKVSNSFLFLTFGIPYLHSALKLPRSLLK